MTDFNDGKIHGWNGGECPVHPKALVDFWFRDSSNIENVRPKHWRWAHLNTEGDIIAFRVTKVHREPKTIWVNESEGIIYGAYLSEEAARRTTYPNTTRVAVKYQEAIEND